MLANFASKTSRILCAVVAGLALVLYMVHLFAPAAVVVGLLCIVAAFGVQAFTRTRSDKTANIIAAVLLVLYFALLLGAGVLLAVEPAWDFGRVYSGALDIAEHGKLTDTLQYFLESNNNFFIAYLLSFWFKALSLVGVAPLYAGIVLNCLAIWASVFVLFWVVKTEWNIQRGCLFLIFSVLFIPLYTYVPIFYTDTLSLPFISFALFFWQQVRRSVGKHALPWLVLLGATGMVGYWVKPSVGIVYVAMLLFALFEKRQKSLKQVLLQVAVAACTAVVLAVGYNALLQATQVIDLTELDRYRLPATHYVMMGLVDGGYNVEDYDLSVGIEDLETRKAVNIATIKARLSDYGVGGYLQFLTQKIEYTWLDGTYYAPWKLSIDPLHDTILSEWFRTDGAFYEIYKSIALGAQIALLLLMIWGMRSPRTLVSMLALSVFGLFLFLLIWETRSRYLVNFIPLFLLLAQSGLDGALPWKTRKGSK